MRTDIPVIRRCCCCLPLRHGLIAWGYFKLVFALLMLINFLGVLYRILILFHERDRLVVPELLVTIVVIAMMILDAILHILFLIGAHKKETKFLRVYYFYSLTILVLTMLLDLICVGFMTKWAIDGLIYYIPEILIATISVIFLNLVIHTYIILLVRSEIIKLDNVGSFRFVNNAAEAECNLRLEQEYEVTDEINAKHEESNEVVV